MQRCPTHDELRSFAAGTLAEVAATAIGQHLGQCMACLNTLEQIDKQTDPFVRDLQDSLHHRLLSEDQCSRAVSRGFAASASVPGQPSGPGDDRPPGALSSSAIAPPEPAGPSVRCPQCRTRFDLPAAPLEECSCPECGERFALAAETPLQDGERTIGHFEILDRLGQGSFGTVWKARDTRLNRIVAVKVVRSGLPEQIEPLLHEARTAAIVKHPSIVSIHEVGRQNNIFYVVSDYIDGHNLATWLDGQRVPPREAAQILCVLAEALQAAHQSGVIHRDLKPGNILMDRSGRPYITDFGLAKDSLGGVTIAVDGHLLGTPAYMSPEQARGQGALADARSDIYSLGVILYEMLAGRAPFQGDLRMVVSQILFEDPPSLAKLVERPPRDLETIAFKCLEKQPAHRYQSAGDLADDLRRYLDRRPIKARPVGWAGSTWRWCKRRPATAMLLAALAVVTTLAFTALTITELQTLAALRTVQEQAYFERISTASQKWLANEPRNGLTVLEGCPAEMRRFEWQYLHGLLDSPEITIPSVNVFAFSPDGKELGTDFSSYPGLQFFNSQTGQSTRYILAGQAWTRSLEYSADGKMLLTDNLPDGLICLRSAADGQLIRTFPGHQRTIVRAHFSADGSRIISWGRDNAVRVWETATAKPVTTIDLRNRRLRWVAVSPVENRVALASGRAAASSLTIWDSTTGKMLEEIPPGGRATTGLAYSPDGRTLAAAEPGGAVRFWQLDPPRLGLVIAGPVSDYPRLVFDPEGKRIAAETPDGTIRIWDTADGRELCALRGNDPPCIFLQFSRDGRRLAASGEDHVLHVWETTPQQGTTTLSGGTAAVVDLKFGPQGETLAAVFKDGAVGVWSISSRTKVWSLPAEQCQATALDYSADGRHLAVGCSDAAVRLLNASTGELVFHFQEHKKPVRAVDFSPDGTQVASAGAGGRVLVWETATGRILHSFSLETTEVRALAFHPEGNRLAAGTGDQMAVVWNLPSSKIAWQSSFPGQPVWDLAWSPDRRTLAVSYRDGRVLLHDTLAATHGPAMGVAAQQFPVHVAFSPDGDRIAIAAAQVGLTFWEVPMGRHVLDFCRTSTITAAVAFDPTGRMLANGQADGTIILWFAAAPKASQAAHPD